MVERNLENRRRVLALAILFGIALIFRLILVWHVELTPYGDAGEYESIASNVLLGNGFSINGQDPTAFRPPLFPIFILFHYLFSGVGNYAPVLYSQAVLSALTCVLVFLLGSWLFGPKTGWAAAGLAVVSPELILYSGVLMAEVLSFFLGVLCVYLALSKKKWTPWLTGLVLGLAVLTRPAMVLIFPGIFIWKLLDRGSSLKQRVRWIGGLLLTLSLVIAPWTIRNYQVFDAFIPMTTHAGYDLWYANRPGSWGGATFGRYTDDPIKTFEGNEVDRDQLGKELGIKAIKEDPLRYIKLCVYRLTVAFSPGQEPLMHRIVGVSTPAMNQRFQAGDKSLEIPISFWGDWMPGLFFGGVIFVAGLGGVGLAFKEDRRWLLLVYASMAYILISSLIVQEIRYRAVATVLLLPLAGYGLVHLREGLSKLFSLPLSRQTVLAWCFAGFLLFSFAYHLIGFNLPGAM